MLTQTLDGLTLDSTLVDLPTHDFQVSLTHLGEVVAKKFQLHPALPGVMLADNEQIVGMISRTQFYEWLSRPYGLETFLRRPIRALWKMVAKTEGILDAETLVDKYLVLSSTCSIDKAVELALLRPSSIAYEPIMIESADGQWRLLDMQVLLLAQSQQFGLAKQAADAANRAKSEFLANMSHELRTPLNAILGFTQVMARDLTLSQEQQQHLGIINRSGEHLLELINDILQMSKIEAGRVTLNTSSVDLYRLLDTLKEMLEFKALSKGLKLVFDYTPDVPQYVRTDEGKLREILTNLLGNAIKFTQVGCVKLRVRRERGERGQGRLINVNSSSPLSPPSLLFPYSLFFEVEDAGPGIAPEEMDKLFTMFGQTEAGRKSHEGTGLGLAISQKFVQLMGGNISVSSTVGKGTTFFFDIQIALAEAPEVQVSQETRKVMGLAPDQPKYRILVVEDCPDNRLLSVKLLTSAGFSVREAENGQDAIKLWSSYSPHLILMDMRMPVMDGYDATNQIKAHPHGQATVIIALTASAFEENRSIVLSAGCDDFIRKPLREEVLWEKLAQYLGVRYLYEESTIEDDRQGNLFHQGTQGKSIEDRQDANSNPSLTFHLSQMPKGWVEQLNQAAVKCLDHVILQLIEQIPEAHTPLANALKNWANNFLFDRVIDLIQQTQVPE